MDTEIDNKINDMIERIVMNVDQAIINKIFFMLITTIIGDKEDKKEKYLLSLESIKNKYAPFA